MRLLLLLLVLGTPCVVAQESKSKLRTWTSSIGTKIEAELVSSTGEQVTLKTKAGRTLQVPLKKLSKADQEFIAAKSSSKEPTNGEASINHNLKYEIKGDAVTITGCDKKASGALTIPAMIEGKSVTNIGEKAFSICMSLTSITIPNSVTSIGEMAFSICMSLTSITIPNSVTSIGKGSFQACTSLTSITIPDTVTSIGSGAFFNCTSLTTVTFLGDAPKAGNAVFLNATPTIYRKPEAKGWGETWGGRPVKLISETKEEAIAKSSPKKPTKAEAPVNSNLKYEVKDSGVIITGCNKKSSGALTIPTTIEGKSVTSIGDKAFSLCGRLTSITIPDSVTSIGDRAFSFCANLTSITIGDSVTVIGRSAFSGCSSLTNITIPDSVTEIGNGFKPCIKLTTIEIGPENVNYTVVDGVLFNKEKTMLLTYPEGKTDANYTIPDSVTSIGVTAFAYCSSLTTVTIPKSVTSIRSGAFSNCTSLANITIPDSVTSIGGAAFGSCHSLTSVTIPDSVTSIGGAAFMRCESLTSITIPSSVTSIEVGAFMGCKSLTSITIPDSVTSIGSSAFDRCTSLTAVTFLGDAPKAYKWVFSSATPTIYRKPEAKGWANYLSGRPVKLISEKPIPNPRP